MLDDAYRAGEKPPPFVLRGVWIRWRDVQVPTKSRPSWKELDHRLRVDLTASESGLSVESREATWNWPRAELPSASLSPPGPDGSVVVTILHAKDFPGWRFDSLSIGAQSVELGLALLRELGLDPRRTNMPFSLVSAKGGLRAYLVLAVFLVVLYGIVFLGGEYVALGSKAWLPAGVVLVVGWPFAMWRLSRAFKARVDVWPSGLAVREGKREIRVEWALVVSAALEPRGVSLRLRDGRKLEMRTRPDAVPAHADVQRDVLALSIWFWAPHSRPTATDLTGARETIA